MNKNTKLIVVAVSALLGIIIVYMVVLNFILFRVSGTTPNLSNVSTASPFIKIHFNKDIVEDYDITSETNIITSTNLGSDKRTVTVSLSNLELRQNYTITVNYVRSTGGKEIRDKKLSFTAKVIDVDKLSKEAQEALMDKQNQGSPNTINDPILRFLPYHAPNYDIEAVVSDAEVSLDVTIRLSNADRGNKQAAIDIYKRQALEYIRAIADDINRYPITYKVEE